MYVCTRTPDPYCIYLLIAERIQSYIITLSSQQSAFSQCFVACLFCLFCSITFVNQSAESTDGLRLHIGGSRKLSSLSKHEVFEQLLQTLNGEKMQT